MPFGEDANDLPLGLFQEEMNTSLLMLIHDLSDHIANVDCHRAIRNFNSLAASLHDVRNSLTQFKHNEGKRNAVRRNSSRLPSIFVQARNASRHSDRLSMNCDSAADACKSDVNSQWSSEVQDQTFHVDEAESFQETMVPPLPHDDGVRTAAVMTGSLEVMDGPVAIQKMEDQTEHRMPQAASQPHLNSTVGLPHHGGSLSNDLRANWRSKDHLCAECTGTRKASVETCKQGHTPEDSTLVEHSKKSPTNGVPKMSRPTNSSWTHRLLETPPVAGLPCHMQPHCQPSDFPMHFDLKL